MSALELCVTGGAGGFELSVPSLRLEGVTAVVGPNGAGKTTLLRLVLGALRPREGRVLIDGEALFDAAAGRDVPVESRRLGYVPQQPVLFGHLDVLDNVAFGLRGRRPERREEARRLLSALGLGALSNRSAEGLSGGERQKIALARALAPKPRALLLDEPFASLDVDARVEARAWLKAQLSRAALPVLMVTHDARDLRALAAEVLALEGGRVAAHGAPEALREATPFLRALLS